MGPGGSGAAAAGLGGLAGCGATAAGLGEVLFVLVEHMLDVVEACWVVVALALAAAAGAGEAALEAVLQALMPG